VKRIVAVAFFLLLFLLGELNALNLKFKKVYQTEDTMQIGEVKILYAKDTAFLTYDSLVFDLTNTQQDSNEIKFDFLHIHRFERYNYRLVIEFEDGIRRSNLFKADTRFSSYTLFIKERELHVENNTSFVKVYRFEIIESFALVIIFILKLLSAFLLIKIMKYPVRLFRYLLICNVFLFPILYFAFPLILPENLQFYLIPETIMLLLETFSVFFLMKKQLKFRKILFLNTYTNLIGYIIYNLIVTTPFVL